MCNAHLQLNRTKNLGGHRSEAASVRSGGALGRENVGTSNHNADEMSARRKPKGSSAMTINGGLVGPKPMAKAAGDGQQVNIPAPLFCFNGVTERSMSGALLDLTFVASGMPAGKSAGRGHARFQVPQKLPRFVGTGSDKARFPEKPLELIK